MQMKIWKRFFLRLFPKKRPVSGEGINYASASDEHSEE